MKSVAVFPKEMEVYEGINDMNEFIIENCNVNTGIIEEPDLILKDCPTPDDMVLVKKIAFSCNYRDKTILLRSDKFIKDEVLKGDLHFTYIGSDFVGEVINIGNNVKGFSIGDKVIPNVSYPSYKKDYKPGIPSNYASSRIEGFKANKLIKIPEKYNIPDEVLAGFSIAGFTSYSMIRKVVKPGAKILVTAANSNTSLMVIKALKKHPVDVYAMTSSSKNKEILLQMGVKDVLVINHSLDRYDDDEVIENKIDQIGDFDAVIDPFFDIYLPRVIDFLSMDSKYITCGLYNQYPDFDNGKYKYRGNKFSDILTKALVKNISIIGNCIGLEEDGLEALEDLNNGKLDIIIDSVFTEGQENLFLDRTFNSKDRFGKVVYRYKQ